VATVMTEKRGWAETLKVIRDAGVPTYDMPEMGAKVLVALGRNAAWRKRPAERPTVYADANAAGARTLVTEAARKGRKRLSAVEGCELLACYGIPLAQYRPAGDLVECLAAADELGYPVVLKIDAESVVHKTESGAVVLNIRDRAALRAHGERLLARFPDAGARLLVQEQLPPGLEVIVGATAAPGLGHVVMFGLGGIHVEILKDVSFKLTPVTAGEARQMLETLRAYPVLRGVRNQPGVDVAALRDLIPRVSQMLVDNPEIQELDINPVFAFADGVKAADVRVML
jgi:acetyltransferase